MTSDDCRPMTITNKKWTKFSIRIRKAKEEDNKTNHASSYAIWKLGSFFFAKMQHEVGWPLLSTVWSGSVCGQSNARSGSRTIFKRGQCFPSSAVLAQKYSNLILTAHARRIYISDDKTKFILQFFCMKIQIFLRQYLALKIVILLAVPTSFRQECSKKRNFVYISVKQCRFHFNLTIFFDKF